MADCESGCSGGCSSGCTSCSGTCSGGCSGSCKGSCRGCTGSCSGGCYTGCTGNCYATCNGNCWSACSESCYKSCEDACKGYCSNICQTYCQKEQIFVKNRDPIVNSVGKPEFSWTYPVTAPTDTAQGSTIKITASEWNTLKSYIQEAVKYCGGTSPSGQDASNDPSSEHNYISAIKYNDLADGLDVTRVETNQLISASVINALKDTYNTRKIIDTLPAGENTGGEDQCCQKGQVCMEQGELLSHQLPITTGCKNGQSATSKPK